MKPADFKKKIWNYYKTNRRTFPWRETTDPYKIVVSEIMLQQTQTYRVEPKYLSWLKRFPSFKKLAKASREEVLKEWQGLGYNRRAIALHEIAKKVTLEYKGKFPRDVETLLSFPGIGPNTAGSILAFAFNEPAVFIETNIRTVFIHFFFHNKTNVDDKEIRELIVKTLDHKNPKEWYYALMDYGVYLKKNNQNLNSRSMHYRKQSKFEGSNRELRSLILRAILEKSRTEKELISLLEKDPEKISANLEALQKEGFIQKKRQKYIIKNSAEAH